MEKTDVLVIGGGPAAIIAAITAKVNNPDKTVTLARKFEKVMVPCGIPYIFGTLNDVQKNVMGDAPMQAVDVKIVINEAVKIDLKGKKVSFADGLEIEYEKLVIATGSATLKPNWLEGREKKGVYYVEKNIEYLTKLFEELKKVNSVVVVGGGFIGVEMAEELVKSGKRVTVVEKMPHVLMAAFDADISEQAEKVLIERGVIIRSGVGIKKITGGDKAEGVELEDGSKIQADAVILAMGYTPEVQLAKDAGIDTNQFGFIRADEYMRTICCDNVFACGDCAEKRDFITRKVSRTMLASTATTEARTAGMNLFKLSVEKSFGGTISIFDTKFGIFGFGVAGVTENNAKAERMDYVTGEFAGFDRHPGTLPDTGKQYVKLIALKDTGTVIGGQVCGAASAGEITNLIGLAIQNKMNVYSLITSQIGTHPLLTSAPTNYPLIKAAEAAMKKMKIGSK
ncbi:MAG: FAD-dependent oxidoreductase [Candidatus Goldbacteria bacterium]|nr:FAD-dependent oxidoreductase [Candidatus Goldiibacteriota bacterium]